jgi:hypothetical protein
VLLVDLVERAGKSSGDVINNSVYEKTFDLETERTGIKDESLNTEVNSQDEEREVYVQAS